MRATDIAIVGMSGVYPDAEGLDEFYRNLLEGVDSVRPLSPERLRYLTFTPSERFSAVASLREIDAFDHEFFKISLREAEYMDPQQRILLQLACAAIENAGLSLAELRGTDTGVFMGAANTDFYRVLEVPDAMAVSGNLPAALAGRIAYQLGLRGPALVLDTACSSSLVAVIDACDRLAAGQVEFALAGGINLFFAEDALAAKLGIAATDGKCKSFDASADGSGWGEGGGVVLLAPLARALELRLPVHAVIRGGAVNQDADRSNGITAPSPQAQGEVIARAWARAGIEPESIGYVEAHGTGTELGDPIEIQGLDQAFGGRAGGCVVGSVKSNIGHLMGAAGMAGLTKAVLSLKHRKLFPSLHYRQPNPYIDFERSAVRVNARLREWEPVEGAPLRAGVSSFGLSGTNAHLVLEEAPRAAMDDAPAGPVPVTLSARSRPALRRYLERVRDSLEGAPLADVAHTLNRGRADHAYRFATWAATPGELRQRLDAALAEGPEAAPARERGVVFVFDDASTLDPARLPELAARVPAVAEAREECGAGAERLGAPLETALFQLQLGLARAWRRAGISPHKMVGTGPGMAVVELLQEKADLAAALAKAASFQGQLSQPNPDRLRQVVERLLGDRPAPVFLLVGTEGTLFQELVRLRREHFPELHLVSSLGADDAGLLPALCELYRAGAEIDWAAHYEGEARRRVELPTYPFEKTPCWNPAILRAHAEAPPVRQPEPPAAEAPAVLDEPDATATQHGVAAVWAEILKVRRLTLDSDYFDLGGHSLNGAQAVARIRERFAVDVAFEEVYDHPTLRELAAHVDALLARAAAPAPEMRMPAVLPAPEAAPLSFTEQRLWFLDQFEPGSPFYNIPVALRVRGPFDPALVRRAIGEVRARHEVLRTAFPARDGRAVRDVRDDVPFPVETVDLAALPPAEREARLRELAAAEAARPFDVARGPLARATVVRMADDDHVLLVTLHHIISDLWSMGLLIREITLFYQAFSGGAAVAVPELPIQYSDFARAQRQWLQGETLERLLDFWRGELEGSPAYLSLPTDGPRPRVQTYRGRHHHFTLPAELVRGLKALARGHDATLFMAVMAGFQLLLHRYTGESRIPVGIPIAGRGRAETEGLIGFFANTLVIATDLGGNPTVAELIGRVRARALGAYAHQDLPFERLLEEIHPQRSLSHSPLFQVMLAFQNIALDVPQLPGIEFEVSEPESGTTQFDLTLSVREAGEGLVGRVEYNVDLFGEETIRRMVAHLEALLAAMVSAPELRLSQVPMWGDEERDAVVGRWNDTAREYPDGPLHELIEAQAARTPDAVALRFEGESLTYAELDRRAEQLAARLARRGVGPESVVGVCSERSPEMVIALLGILKSGAAYLPLDPANPPARLEYMLGHSGARVVLAQRAFAALLDGGGYERIELEDAWAAGDDSGRVRPRVLPENGAYVIYTSGTTGLPKGVMVPHRGIVNRLFWMQEAFGLGADDAVLQKTPYTFDVSVWEFFWPLMTGATLVIARPGGHRDPDYLVETIEREGITTLHFVPSMLNAFLQARGVAGLSGVRRVMCSGEALAPESVQRFHETFAGAELHNLYGPTEASVDVSWWAAKREEIRTVPIGKPIANTTLYVLGAAMEPLPAGVAGELYIGGVQLARGYASDAAQTAERFVPDPFGGGGRLYRTGDRARWLPTGEIEYLGRADHQVKIRGYRIEPAEVEHALCAHAAVREAMVLAVERAGRAGLVAYVVPETEAPTVAALREALLATLPEYMVPAHFVVMEAFPLTPNGKVDRRALPRPGDERPELESAYEQPEEGVQQQLAEIWSRLLGVERVGVRDNFFELGGDSILSIQVVARAADAGIRLTPRQMFEHQTIAELAAVAGQSQAVAAEQGMVSGEVALAPVQHWLLERGLARPGHWNQALMLAGEGELDPARLFTVLHALVEHHDALRHRFHADPWRQEALPTADGSLDFAWEELSWVSAATRAARIAELVDEAQRGLDLENGPLVRAVGMRWGGEWRLLLVIHHLVVDGVSWRILLEDLQKGIRQLAAGEEVRLGRKTTSFRYWSERLGQWAADAEEELPYWLDEARREVLALPRDGSGENLEGSAEWAAASLDEERTRQLLQDAPRAYGTSVQEVLLAALAAGLLQWSGQGRGRVLVEMEGHGREELFEEVELTRTVGWFTAMYPVSLPASLQEPLGESLKRTKEVLRQVPGRGVGYGVLRYLGRDEVKTRLAALPQPEVSFNYLGRLDEVLEAGGAFRAASESVGASRAPEGMRAHLLEVSASVTGGRLELRFGYSRAVHRAESVARLVELTRTRLLELIEHCLNPDAGAYTPSDFPAESLSEQDLGEIMAQIGGGA